MEKLTQKINFWGIQYIFFYFVFFFFYYHRAFIANLNNVQEDWLSGVFIIAWVIFNLLLFMKAYRSIDFIKAPLRKILFFGAIFNLLLLPLLPVTSTDLFNYISRGRIFAIHGANPYLVPFSSFPTDKFFSDLTTLWQNQTTLYGPFFTLLSSFLAYLGQKHILFSVYLFKIFFMVLNVATSYFIYLLTKSKRALFLYAWNPYIIFEFSLNAHNDVLMIFLVVLSFVFLKSHLKFKQIFGFLSLVLSSLVKPFSLLLIPFYIVTVNAHYPNFVQKFKAVTLYLLIWALVVICMYSPFWEGPIIFKRVFDVSRYISVFASPLVIALYAVLKLVGVNNFYFWGNVLGKISFLLIYTLLFIRFFLDANRGKFDNFVFMSMVVMAAFLLTTLNWFMSWYWIILFVLMIISFAKTKVKTYPYLMVGLSIWAAIQLTVAR